MNKKWQQVHEFYVIKNYETLSDQELCDALRINLGFITTAKAVKLKRQRLGLDRPRGGKREGSGRCEGTKE